MVIIYNKYASICSSQDEVCKLKRAPGLLNHKSLPDIGNADHNTLAPKPPRSVMKILHNTRNGMTHRPPVESRPGGNEKDYNTTYGSFFLEVCLRRNF